MESLALKGIFLLFSPRFFSLPLVAFITGNILFFYYKHKCGTRKRYVPYISRGNCVINKT